MVEQPFQLRKSCLFKNIDAKNDNAKSEAKKSEIFSTENLFDLS
jgi:hypothetical protein